MISFASDYIAGAHPAVLKRLIETNLENLSGYGSDFYCKSAAEKIKKACGCPEGEVYFITGGTQTNQLIISTMLEPYEGVVAANTGHISVHEAGAIEYTGHKVLIVDESSDALDQSEKLTSPCVSDQSEKPTSPGALDQKGKVTASGVEKLISGFYADENHEHMVYPGMVYITFPTEYGTIYSKQELTDIYAVCRKYEIPLYIDGARLGYGLCSKSCDVTLQELASLCDVFYIGGTKVGALCGEAVVFTKANAPKHFLTQIKQHGALLAKGRLLGVQFDALFTDDLYYDIGRHAIEMAERLKDLFHKKGYRFFLESPTNQQFIILDNNRYKELSKTVEMSFWEKYDETSTVVRFATSWSTSDEDLMELEKVL